MAELIHEDDDRAEYSGDGWGPSPSRSGLVSELWRRIDPRSLAVAGVAVLVGAAVVVGVGADDDPEAANTLIQAEVAEATDGPAMADALALRRDDSDLAARIIGGDDPTTSSSTTTTSTPGSSSEATTTSTSALVVEADPAGNNKSGPSSTLARETSSSTGSSSTSTTEATNTSSTTSTTTTATTRPSSSSSTTGSTTTTRPTTTTTRPTTTTTRATTTTRGSGNSCATGAEFERIMRDDFNGSSVGGQWLVWNQDTGNAGNGRRMASQLSVSNGRLLIEAEMVNGTLHSGGMNHTHAQTYGKYRFRVRTDVDPSRAMSGVILTWPTSDNHLRDGENNAYETLPHQDSPTRNPFYSFVHKPFASNAGQQEYKIWRADASQWQTITMEWTPSRLSISRDGGETWTVNETSADLIPDVPHRFHIQLDAFKQSISGRVTMEVDYAEVYRYCG